MALARAGAETHHVGRVGDDGRWLCDTLAENGVDVSLVRVDAEAHTGHALIQVDDRGENSIILFPGANQRIETEQVASALERFGPGDVLLLQNETNAVAASILAGKRRGMTVVFNPAPMSEAVHGYPLDAVDLLVVNETEWDALGPNAYRGEVVLTLGAKGARCFGGDAAWEAPGMKVEAVDTTAAGDTFIGYLLAARAQGLPMDRAMRRACRAAALTCTRPGAIDAIPGADAVDAFEVKA